MSYRMTAHCLIHLKHAVYYNTASTVEHGAPHNRLVHSKAPTTANYVSNHPANKKWIPLCDAATVHPHCSVRLSRQRSIRRPLTVSL